MSILIKGMEKLPRQGAGIGLMIWFDGSIDTFCIDYNGETSMFLNHTDFKATEVPTPHGDLIDKHIILNEIYEYMYDRNYAVGHLYDVISEKTAVIEREE